MGLLVLALVGLAIGIWLGRPGRFEQTPEDIERLMAQGGGTRRKRQKRSLSPVAWLQRKLSPRSPPPSRRRGFRVEAPGESKDRSPRPIRATDPRASRPTPASDADEASAERKQRTRQTLREGRFKLRPPGEGGPG